MTELYDKIVRQIVADFYNQPIMSNLTRPHYVERIIAFSLGEGWTLVSANWSGWDIENSEGVRIEVKQSAARQVWTDRPSLGGKPSKGVFDIAARTGYWAEDGSVWVKTPGGRLADIYIFAWHPILDKPTADQRDPSQWEFYVVAEGKLPPKQKTIVVTSVAKEWGPAVSYKELRDRLSEVVDALPETKTAAEARARQ